MTYDISMQFNGVLAAIVDTHVTVAGILHHPVGNEKLLMECDVDTILNGIFDSIEDFEFTPPMTPCTPTIANTIARDTDLVKIAGAKFGKAATSVIPAVGMWLDELALHETLAPGQLPLYIPGNGFTDQYVSCFWDLFNEMIDANGRYPIDTGDADFQLNIEGVFDELDAEVW